MVAKQAETPNWPEPCFKWWNGYIAGVISHFSSLDRCRCEAPYREGSDYPRRVHGEDKGGEGYVSSDVSESEVEA